MTDVAIDGLGRRCRLLHACRKLLCRRRIIGAFTVDLGGDRLHLVHITRDLYAHAFNIANHRTQVRTHVTDRTSHQTDFIFFLYDFGTRRVLCKVKLTGIPYNARDQTKRPQHISDCRQTQYNTDHN